MKKLCVLILICNLVLVFFVKFVVVKRFEPKVCTAEAKLCPNGSYVGRVSELNCKFAVCNNQLPALNAKAVTQITLPGQLWTNSDPETDKMFRYWLVFTEPLKDTTSAIGEDNAMAWLQRIPLVTEQNWDSYLNKKVMVSGNLEWGIAESKIIRATSVFSYENP